MSSYKAQSAAHLIGRVLIESFAERFLTSIMLRILFHLLGSRFWVNNYLTNLLVLFLFLLFAGAQDPSREPFLPFFLFSARISLFSIKHEKKEQNPRATITLNVQGEKSRNAAIGSTG
jgi:hypothetical protein